MQSTSHFLKASMLALVIITSAVRASSQSPEELRIAGLLEQIKAEDNTVTQLDAKSLKNLPIGIRKTISNNTIIIAIDTAKLVPGGALVNASTQFKMPGTGKTITLAAKHVFLSLNGMQQSQPARLAVITEFDIPISPQVSLVLPADGSNYIEWDCEGFKSLNIKGLFEFASTTFTPDPELSKNATKVTAALEVHTSDLNNITADVSITPFRINGLGDMAFSVTQAGVDMSDFSNCPGFVLPPNYKSTFGDQPNLWRGFFLKDLKIYLPSELSNSKGRSYLDAHNLLIDESGVSGTFSGTDLLPINEGSASGWPFSVKTISVTLTQNRLTGGGFAGVIGVPFLSNDTLGYAAQVQATPQGLQYYFAASINNTKDIPLPLGGVVRLNRGSTFGMTISQGKFVPEVILNGSLYLTSDIVKAQGLHFERLHLIAQSPYITEGKFSVAGGTGFKLAGFSFSLDSISLGFSPGKAELGFNVKVSLVNSSDKSLSAKTRFLVKAAMQTEPDPENPSQSKQHWTYDGVQVNSLYIDVSIAVFKLQGQIDLRRNDPVYGDGFHGNVSFTLENIIKNPVTIEVYFGQKDNYKYWFTKITVPVGIPIGPIKLESLTGGAYSHMKRQDLYSNTSDYVPDANSGLGFLAGVGLSVANPNLIYADVLFEIAFNTSGGVRYIRFQGDGQFFSGKVKKSNPPVKASLCVVFDNDNDIFHANFKVYLNVAGVLKGIGPDNLLGEAVIHSDPNDWYIYFGRPSAPMGVSVLGLLTVQGYFMAGTKLENMPLPPAEVSSILGGIDLDFMKKESAAATSGRGVAFGMRFNISFGFGRDGGFVYAYLDVGAGCDIMLRDYGNVSCRGHDGLIGIDGWYASGQSYAYLQGKVGIRVKGSEFDILSVAAAMLMQAKLPNPAYFKGYLAARYSVLGGLVKGKVNVTVTLGEECEIVSNGSELGGIKLIGDIQPAKNGKDVDVFTAQQVAFNTSIDKEFGMMNLADQYNIYRVRLDDYKVSSAGNPSLTGTLRWNANKDVAMLKLKDILPGQQDITSFVKVHIEKKTKTGWQALTDSTGGVSYETETSTYTTGAEPTTVTENNVAYSYPIKNQYNFLKGEYPHGYIKLNYGQPNLFKAQSDGKTWQYVARFKPVTGNAIETPLVYNDNETQLEFNIPQNLQLSKVYNMSVIKKPLTGEVDQNLERTQVDMAVTNEGDSLSKVQNNLTGSVAAEAETELHSFPFRTSVFNTFNDKLNSLTGWEEQYAVDETLMSLLGIEATTRETFDKYDLDGRDENTLPLVYAEAQRGNQWLDQHVYPQVYENYGNEGITLDRNTEVLGVCPLKGMTIFNFGESDYLLDANVPGVTPGDAPKTGNIAIRYFIPHYVYVDFFELRNKAAARYLGNAAIPLYAQKLLNGSIDDIYRGRYPFKVNYRLPGTNTITTSRDYGITF